MGLTGSERQGKLGKFLLIIGYKIMNWGVGGYMIIGDFEDYEK